MVAPSQADNFRQPLLTTTAAAVPSSSSWPAAAETSTGTGSAGRSRNNAHKSARVPDNYNCHSEEDSSGHSSSDGGEARNLVFGDGCPRRRAAGAGGGEGEVEAYELQDYGAEDVAAIMSKSHGHYPAGDDDAVEMSDYGADGLGSDGSSQRLSTSTTADFQLYTPDEEKAVVRKFDRRLVLFLSACYLLSFLDRSSASCPHHISLPPPSPLPLCRRASASPAPSLLISPPSCSSSFLNPPLPCLIRRGRAYGLLTWCYRYRKCTPGRHGARSPNPPPEGRVVYLVTDVVLYRLHRVWVDEFAF
jgi:hypothetical protein